MSERQRPGTRPGARATRTGDRPGRTARRTPRAGVEAADATPIGIDGPDPAGLAEESKDADLSESSPRRIRPRAAREQGRERTVLGLSTSKAVVLAAVVFALALTLAVPLRTYLGQRSDAQAVAAQRAELEQRVADLQVQKDQAADPAYIAAQARERLGFVMPGETPYQVQLPGARAYSDIAKDTPPAPPGPWYSTLWSSAVDPLGK